MSWCTGVSVRFAGLLLFLLLAAAGGVTAVDVAAGVEAAAVTTIVVAAEGVLLALNAERLGAGLAAAAC